MALPWVVALGCALALTLPACFNPQPEPPGKSSEFEPEDGSESDAATGTTAGNGGAGGGGGQGGQGGAAGSLPAPFDLDQGGVTVTTGGSSPTNLVKPSIDHHAFDGTTAEPSAAGAHGPSISESD